MRTNTSAVRLGLLIAALGAWSAHGQQNDNENDNWGVKPNSNWGVKPSTNWGVKPDQNQDTPKPGSHELPGAGRIEDARRGLTHADTPTKLLQGATRLLQGATRANPTKEHHEDRGTPGHAAKSEPAQLSRGKRAHKEEPVLAGEKTEVPTPSGKRMDRYNPDTKHIREIKPNNPRAIRQGEKQVEDYKNEMEKSTGQPHTGEVSPYDPKDYE